MKILQNYNIIIKNQLLKLVFYYYLQFLIFYSFIIILIRTGFNNREL